MHGQEKAVRMSIEKDWDHVEELCEEFGLYFHVYYDLKEKKDVYCIKSTLCQFDSIQKCIKWLHEEFEEK